MWQASTLEQNHPNQLLIVFTHLIWNYTGLHLTSWFFSWFSVVNVIEIIVGQSEEALPASSHGFGSDQWASSDAENHCPCSEFLQTSEGVSGWMDWSLKSYCDRKQSVAWAHSNILPSVGWEPWWPAWRFPGWVLGLHYCWGTEAAAGMSKNTNKPLSIWLEQKLYHNRVRMHMKIPKLIAICSYSDCVCITLIQ